MARVFPAKGSPKTASPPPPPYWPDFREQKSSDSPASADRSAPSPWPALPDVSPSAHRLFFAAPESCSDHPAGTANPPPRSKHSPPSPLHKAPAESVPDSHPPASLFCQSWKSTSHIAPPHPASRQSASRSAPPAPVD